MCRGSCEQGSAALWLWQRRVLGVRTVVARASDGCAGCVKMVEHAVAAGSGRHVMAVQGIGRDRGPVEAQGRLRRKYERTH